MTTTLRSLRSRVRRWLSPTAPTEPDVEESGEEHTGASEEYGDKLEADKFHEQHLRAIAEDYGLNLIVREDATFAEAILAVRQSHRQLLGEFNEWLDSTLDDFHPGWSALALPDFEAVRELVEAA